MVIAIISESRSASVRNRDRHHLGTLIAIARNTHIIWGTRSTIPRATIAGIRATGPVADGKGGLWRIGDRSASGPRQHVRAADLAQTSDAVHGLRRQDRVAVRARHDHARNRGALEENLRRKSAPG